MKLKLSGAAMGAAVEVSRGYWSELEHNKATPSKKLLAALGREFFVRDTYVLEGQGPMFDIRRRNRGKEVDISGRDAPATYEAFEHRLAAGMQMSIAEEGLPSWKAEEKIAAYTAHSRGPDGPPYRRDTGEGALLPVRGARAVRPLKLSLPLGELGGPGKDYELIPRHIRQASAGAGGAVADADENELLDLAGDMAFSFEWLRHNLRHTTGRLCTIQVRGNSMATTLFDGDTIMIDQGVSSVDVDDIYVIEVRGRRMVKRVQHLFDGTLVLISDNQSYQRETIPRDQARDVRVIGRMVWPRVR